MTHSLSPDARQNGRWHESRCGAWVKSSEHADRPDCKVCAADLARERADTRTPAEVFGDPREGHIR
jgi:hypothetical protein